MTAGLKTRPGDLARFWSKVNQNGPIPEHRPELGPCWLWTGFIPTKRNRDGYGRFWANGRNHRAHRWIVEAEEGAIPAGHEPDHLCRNRACVRRAHLEVVTQVENTRRAHILRRGIRTGNANVMAERTHCPKNHEYTPENTRVYKGKRNCRACSRAASAAYYRRKVAA